jgi:head-tail adaptor
MSLASLMSETIDIYRYTSTTTDSTGDEVKVWSQVGTADAFVGRAGIASSRWLETSEEIVGRDQVLVDYSFMVPPETDITAYDRIVHDGLTFEVVGVPSKAIKPGSGAQFILIKGKHITG